MGLVDEVRIQSDNTTKQIKLLIAERRGPAPDCGSTSIHLMNAEPMSWLKELDQQKIVFLLCLVGLIFCELSYLNQLSSGSEECQECVSGDRTGRADRLF